MISVADALARLFALAAPGETEFLPLAQANGRVLAQAVAAMRHQPPFDASAMDGYALAGTSVHPGATYTIVGEAAAGHALDMTVPPGATARIFTGAPMPAGTDRVIIQEDVQRSDDTVTVNETYEAATYVRPAGADFKKGDTIDAPRVLTPNDIALLAAMNIASVPVARRPIVAIIATGDELVQPGEAPGPDQIIASNSYGLAALIAESGGHPRLLPIARDNDASLDLAFDLARDADLIVTIGGASVGDHDLVAAAAAARGMQRDFYKIAMRPGKPLMAGRLGNAVMIGLPGNPVSAMVCGHVFVLPVIRKMLGLPAGPAPRCPMVLKNPLAANGAREHYMRAVYDHDGVRVFDRQDSALLSVLASANGLVIRPAFDEARQPGEIVQTLPFKG